MGIIIHPRKNQLTKEDLKNAKKTLRKGDIILVGNLRTILHKFIAEPVTHSALYVGNHQFIHAKAEGVQYISLYKVFLDYDTLAILRIPRKKKNVIRGAIRFAQSQYGKPYDFQFTDDLQSFFCTKLVNESFRAAGYDTGLSSFKRPKKRIELLEEYFSGAVDALQPKNFFESNFEVVFLSHNLAFTKGKLFYK